VKICIYGAGAIGAYFGLELAESDAEVSLIARGAHLAAMRANGVRVRSGDDERQATLTATDDPAELGPQDFVIVTLKAHSVPAICGHLKPLLGPQTAVVTATNGIPWWYFYKLPGAHEGRRVSSVDPGGVQWETIGPERAIGCVVYTAAEIVEPGVITVSSHLSQKRLPLGEPDGSRSTRAMALSGALAKAGFKAPVRPDIRSDIWVKLWGNLAFNPVSALTSSTLEDIAHDPATRGVVRKMMLEGQQVGEALGARFPIEVDRRIDGAGQVGAHRTSMLQDLESGRPMEIDALVGIVGELGRLVDVPTPTIDAVYALVKRRAIEAGCYPG
jgi:2-dehydropantoate 2-reductase